MDAAKRNGWKIFGIIIIILLLAAAVAVSAYFIGRESGDDGQGRTTTVRTPPTPAPAGAGTEEVGGTAAPAAEETSGAESPERYVVGEGEGSTPCIDGMRTTTRTTYYSDGSTDTVTVTEPCSP
ncbi:MAG: hypothetical protein IBX61_08815 [Thermoleophilia bacterium]|nr:hypothetical protein [Thermoleophilia bacterium]